MTIGLDLVGKALGGGHAANPKVYFRPTASFQP
jgi:hypothetical protein